MKLGLCVVGCGQYAQTFAQGIQPILGEIDLYFASRDRQRAEAYSQMFQGSGAFGSYQEAAADSRVEAMYLCTPHHLHLEHVAMAARAGKHVLLEKPISTTLEDGQRIIAAAEEAGITLMVAENFRFMPAVRRCKDLVDRGEVGNLRMIQLQEEASFQPSQWRAIRDLNGGGVFIDGGIHKVHFLRYLAGEPEHIFATAMPKALSQHEGEDGLVMVAKWSCGLVGLINHSWVAVTGTKGRIYFELGTSQLRLEQCGREQAFQLDDELSGLDSMVREFRDSIREGRLPEVPGIQGLNDLALVLKAYESIEQGVSLPFVPCDWR